MWRKPSPTRERRDSRKRPPGARRFGCGSIRFRTYPRPLLCLRIEGAMLEPKQILELARLIEEAGEVRAALNLAGEKYPRLAAQVAATADPRPILRDVRGKILADGTVADDASVALHRLRRDIERQQRQIQTSLERFLRTHRDDGTLQEEFITLRNDRFVVPVVAGQQRKVYGVIHGASGSGHTLFVEPLETIDLNNELVRLREEEQREVARILRELTELLRTNGPQIQALVAAIGRLDLLFAKAEFASDFDCVIPRFSPEKDRRLVLEGRAPSVCLQDVLRRQKKPILPISLALDEKQRTLLISGPNTGGKTVSMKTVGLLALMAQAGLPVPAAEAEFPLFEQVLAEIGDQQSIQESLSSFSGHIARVREMLETVTPQSLVLLDELGRATDPEEGGPLGVAILGIVPRAWRVHFGVHASVGAEDLWRHNRGRGECVHGLRRKDIAAHLCFAVGRAGEIRGAGDREPSGALGRPDRAGAPAHVHQRARYRGVSERTASAAAQDGDGRTGFAGTAAGSGGARAVAGQGIRAAREGQVQGAG